MEKVSTLIITEGSIMTNKKFIAAGFAVAIILAGVLSFYASSSPDGLEKVAQQIGFVKTEKEHALSSSPLAGYGVKNVENERLSVGVSGVIGVIVIGAASTLLFRFLRKK